MTIGMDDRILLMGEVVSIAQEDVFLRPKTEQDECELFLEDGLSTRWVVRDIECLAKCFPGWQDTGTLTGDLKYNVWDPVHSSWMTLCSVSGMSRFDEEYRRHRRKIDRAIDGSHRVLQVAQLLSEHYRQVSVRFLAEVLREIVAQSFYTVLMAREVTGSREVDKCAALFDSLSKGLFPFGMDCDQDAIVCFRPKTLDG